MSQLALMSFGLCCDFGESQSNYNMYKSKYYWFKKITIVTINKCIVGGGTEMSSEMLIKQRFLMWHYNRKCLCKIRKLIILLSSICNKRLHWLSVDSKHLLSVTDPLNL